MPIGERTHSQSSLPALEGLAGCYTGSRCRDCEGYPDPHVSRGTCTITGKRRAGYMGICGHQKLRPVPVMAHRVRRCATVGCDADLSGKSAKTNYCDECLARIRKFRIGPKRSVQPQVEKGAVMNEFRCPHPGCDRSFEKFHGLQVHQARTHGSIIQTPPPVALEKSAEQRDAHVEAVTGAQRAAEAVRAAGMSMAAGAAAIRDAFAPFVEDPAVGADTAPSFAEQMRQDAEADELADGGTLEPRRCRICGCTDDEACEGGCSWVEEDLCSTCADALDPFVHITDDVARRDALLHETIDGILQEDDAPAISILVSSGVAEEMRALRLELAITHLRLIDAEVRAFGGLRAISESTARTLELVKAL